jgi:hypothetical protein
MMKHMFPQPVFAPETLTGARATKTALKGSFGIQSAGNLMPLFGWYPVPANVEDGDIFEMLWIPRNTVIFGGQVTAADLDTGTEALDMDLGWAANGGESTDSYSFAHGVGSDADVAATNATLFNAGYQADPDGFGNFGVWSGDGVTDLFAAGQIYRPIILTKPLFFSRDTKVLLEANVAANSFTAGDVTVCLWGMRV